MNNIIIDNRIVNDKTFAIRLKSFIEKVTVCDQSGEEEKEYLLFIANKLLDYQIATATDDIECEYLRRLNLM